MANSSFPGTLCFLFFFLIFAFQGWWNPQMWSQEADCNCLSLQSWRMGPKYGCYWTGGWFICFNEKSFKNQTYEKIDLILNSTVYPLIHQNLFLVFFPFWHGKLLEIYIILLSHLLKYRTRSLTYFNLSKGLWVITTNINCDRLQDGDILATKPVGMLYSVSLYQTASSNCIFFLIGG